MREQIKIFVIIILGVVIAIILISIKFPKNEPQKVYLYKEKIDTLWVEKKYKPDTIIHTKVKIIYRKQLDTIYVKEPVVNPFIAEDTLITRRDSIRVFFYYPEIYFKYYIQPKKDSIPQIIKTITIRDTVKPSIWDKARYVIVGIGLGILIKTVWK